jgi:MoaA/NifB/PqqE/SkfB family radical SAM enzyme
VSREALLAGSDVFCMAPWAHLHVLTTGEVFPCCMAAHDPRNAVGNLRQGDTLETAWNSEPMRALRRRMLAGEPSALCDRCYRTEEAGQRSWRTSELRQLAHHFDAVGTTDPTGRLPGMDVPYLDVRFSNVCNLSCRICSPHLSSSWHRDGVRLGMVEPGQPAIVRATEDPEELWRQIEPLLPRCERFHFAGGEPLLMEEHYRVLERLLELGRHEVRLSYNTNLSRLSLGRRDVVELWKRFPHIYLQASLDGAGSRGEYMRKGVHWAEVVENRRRMQRECPHVRFLLLPTVSIMNVLHLPDFHREWVEAGLIGPSDIQINLLFDPRLYNIRGLPPHLKARVDARYRAVIDGWLAGLGPGLEETKEYYESVLRYMHAEDWDVGADFARFTAALDHLRNERFASVFPEIAEMALPPSSPAAGEDDPRMHVWRAEARRAAGDHAGALDDLARAVTLAPAAALSQLSRSIAAADNGRIQLPGMRPDPRREDPLSSLASGLYLRGVARRELGDRAGALEDFEQAVTLQPALVPAARARDALGGV